MNNTMKKTLYFIFLPCLFLLTTFGTQAQEVSWMSWEEAVQTVAAEGGQKKIFIDVYTDWCGWCKKMDKDTFQNPEVAAYMQENFYMVKLDAEQKDPIEYNGKTYTYVASGRRGYHQLAAALLQGQLSYPTVVFLDEDLRMLSPVPGYQKPAEFLKIARFFGEDIYKQKDWEAYTVEGR
jgi:thioredoxin-related protein